MCTVNFSHENFRFISRKDELCLVNVDDTWHRGVCDEVVGDEYPTILFIDYGCCYPISIDKIRKMPKQFTHRCVVVDCNVDGKRKNMKSVNCEFYVDLFV